MLREAGSPGRSFGVGVALLLGALTAAGCNGARRPEPQKTDAEYIDPALFTTHAKFLKEYKYALLLLNSENPKDWADGKAKLAALHPFHVFREDPTLLEKLRNGTPAEADIARRELGRRGRLLDGLLVFAEPYSKTFWDKAAKELIAAGEDGRALLTVTLLKMLINGQFRPVWTHCRELLVQAGDMALETTVAVARERAEKSPPTPIWKQEDMVQLTMVLIAFGDKGRLEVFKMAKHKNWNIRKAVAMAIADAMDRVPLADILVGYLDDPEWQVQAAAAEAMGKMGAARASLGPLLVAKMKKERDHFVLKSVLVAIGEMHYLGAIPDLILVIDHPRFETAEAAMYALYRLTGEKFKHPQQWKIWYAEVYPAWIKKQKP